MSTRLAFVVLGLATVVIGSAAALRQVQSPIVMLATPAVGKPVNGREPLQPLWALPDFSLIERTGQSVSLADLKGKVWVADFFYTTCPGPCPMLSSRLSALHKELAGEKNVRLVSISTDPEKDTPDVLKLYAERFGASDRWLFLTGNQAEIFALANKGFKLTVVRDPDAEASAEPITHSTKLVLVDRAGVVRGFYEGAGEQSVAELLRDIRALLAEK